MDRQEAKLRHQLAGTGVSVTRMGDNITLNMPGNITFGSASAELNPASTRAQLVNIVLKEYEKTVVEVAGHTDSTGAAEYTRNCPSAARIPLPNTGEPGPAQRSRHHRRCG